MFEGVSKPLNGAFPVFEYSELSFPHCRCDHRGPRLSFRDARHRHFPPIEELVADDLVAVDVRRKRQAARVSM